MTLRHRVDAVTVTLAGKVYFGMLSPALPGQYRAWRADIRFLKLMWCAGKLPGDNYLLDQAACCFKEIQLLPLMALD